MATAYKYVERRAEDNINWAEVGQNFNNMLTEEMRVREEKKAAIDQASREYQKVLNNVPQGENSDLNGFALDFSDKLQKQMLMQETLLKSGQLSPKQYTMMRQNLTDGTDQGFSLLQDYNNEYSAKMELLGDDVAYSDQLSQLDLDIMANVEGFSNFNNSELVINPETGLVSMGMMMVNPDDPSGPKILDPNRNNLVSVQNLKNRIKTKITKFDVVGAAEEWTSTLGEDIKQTVKSMGTTYSAGTLLKIEDIRAREGGYADMSDEKLAEVAAEMGVKPSDLKALSLWEEAANTWADGQLGNGNYNGASILIDFNKSTPDGEQYTSTFNEADTLDANGNRKQNVILMKSENGRTITELTDEQSAVAQRSLQTQANMQVDYKETVDAKRMKFEPRPKTPTEDKNLKADKEAQSDVGNFAKLWYGNDTEVQEAEDFLRSLNPDIISFDRDGASVVVEFKDGTSETIPFTDDAGARIDQASFIKGNVNKVLGADNKIKDIDATLAKSKFDKNAVFNDASVGFSAIEGGDTQEGIDVAFKREIRNIKPPAGMIVEDDEDKSLISVQQWMAKIPGISGNFTAVTSSDGSDFIEIKDSDENVVSSIQFDDKPTASQLQAFYDSVYELSMNNTSVEDKAIKVQGKRQTISTPKRTSKKQKTKLNVG